MCKEIQREVCIKENSIRKERVFEMGGRSVASFTIDEYEEWSELCKLETLLGQSSKI